MYREVGYRHLVSDRLPSRRNTDHDGLGTICVLLKSNDLADVLNNHS